VLGLCFCEVEVAIGGEWGGFAGVGEFLVAVLWEKFCGNEKMFVSLPER